ncbi:beta-D-glucosyl crocetin beta-1,6-glucosyltransferase-like [Actinidia eriantha]|uniref:beta-D-glucosyl crocetin beta-1,6-glucosyltransferase-like n=1 Tax=Actinidia eriantha TaxID=165200 RepID=UPI00258C101E|nr:beta-D-glucosyl crocetin beta-1,6-glucosyltransferase-like [Actinidia eriantha]
MDPIRDTSIRVLMLPWLAHGHISPFLELAKSLSNRNFQIYLCSTPINLISIKQTLTQKTSTSIKLVEIPLPMLPDLPPHHHTTNGLPPHLMPTLKRAFDMSQPSFSNILDTIKPDLVIYDFLQPWAPQEALSRNIPSVLFLSTGAATTSFLNHHCHNQALEFPFPTIYIKDYEKKKIDHLLKSTASDLNDTDRVQKCIEQSSGIVLIKSSRAIEGKYIDYTSVLIDKKMIPVGPLVHKPIVDDEKNEIFQWLDKKEWNSTILATFGSEYFLSREEIEELAHGLELSGVNFIWIVRFLVGEKIRVDEVLPKSFLDRVWERGLVVEGWAPQAQILAHPSTGGFLSHCGWSSIMEGIEYGVPIIAIPMHLDQPLNARLVEEVGVGLEVERDGSGRLDREEIARVVKEVVRGKRGEIMRRKAKKLGEETREKGEEEMDGVVEELVKICK